MRKIICILSALALWACSTKSTNESSSLTLVASIPVLNIWKCTDSKMVIYTTNTHYYDPSMASHLIMDNSHAYHDCYFPTKEVAGTIVYQAGSDSVLYSWQFQLNLAGDSLAERNQFFSSNPTANPKPIYKTTFVDSSNSPPITIVEYGHLLKREQGSYTRFGSYNRTMSGYYLYAYEAITPLEILSPL